MIECYSAVKVNQLFRYSAPDKNPKMKTLREGRQSKGLCILDDSINVKP